MYAIVQTESPSYARVISRHRTREAAEAAHDRAHRALRRQPGSQQSYYDWHIIELAPGATRARRVNRITGGLA